jgi:hypothetical protein
MTNFSTSTDTLTTGRRYVLLALAGLLLAVFCSAVQRNPIPQPARPAVSFTQLDERATDSVARFELCASSSANWSW